MATLASVMAVTPTFASQIPDSVNGQLLAVRGDWTEVKSDRSAVRERNAAGGWMVLYGDPINEAEYAKIGGCAYFGCLPAYLKDYVRRSVDRMYSRAPGVAYDRLLDAATRAMSGQQVQVGRMGIAGGLATYRRWKEVSMHKPVTRICTRKTPVGRVKYPCLKMELLVSKVPLPSHHQPYLKFRF